MKDKQQPAHTSGAPTSTAQNRGMAEVWQTGEKQEPPTLLAVCPGAGLHGSRASLIMLHRRGVASRDLEDAAAWWHVSVEHVVMVGTNQDGGSYVTLSHGQIETDAPVEDVVWAVNFRLGELRQWRRA